MLLFSQPTTKPCLEKSLCETFSFKVVEKSPPSDSPYFSYEGNILSLHLDTKTDLKKDLMPSKKPTYQPLSFDFIETWKKIKQGPKGQKKKDPLLKAISLKKAPKSIPLTLIDATCGTGKDSLFFIKQGIKVMAYERSPFLAPLLWDAQRRALSDPELGPILEENFFLSFLDAKNHKKNLESPDVHTQIQSKDTAVFLKPDLIFLDPMFPPKRKKALPKKEMVLFSHLVGPDEDQENLLSWAIDTKPQRVIVKRPLWATPPKEFPPHTSYQGKTVKFDTYFPNL